MERRDLSLPFFPESQVLNRHPALVRFFILLASICTVGFLAACDETFISVDSSGHIELRFGNVRWDAEVVTVNNEGMDTVFHFTVESETAALLDWVPCYDPDPASCPQIAPGDTLEMPYSDIIGYEAGDSLAYFHWWTRSERTVRTEELRLR